MGYNDKLYTLELDGTIQKYFKVLKDILKLDTVVKIESKILKKTYYVNLKYKSYLENNKIIIKKE